MNSQKCQGEIREDGGARKETEIELGRKRETGGGREGSGVALVN